MVFGKETRRLRNVEPREIQTEEVQTERQDGRRPWGLLGLAAVLFAVVSCMGVTAGKRYSSERRDREALLNGGGTLEFEGTVDFFNNGRPGGGTADMRRTVEGDYTFTKVRSGSYEAFYIENPRGNVYALSTCKINNNISVTPWSGGDIFGWNSVEQDEVIRLREESNVAKANIGDTRKAGSESNQNWAFRSLRFYKGQMKRNRRGQEGTERLSRR